MAPTATSVTLRVDSPSLGPVGIRVQLRGSLVDARLSVASPSAGGQLLAGGGALRAGLGRYGLQLGGLQVGVGSQGDQAPAWSGSGQPGPPPASGDSPAAAPWRGRAAPGPRSGRRLDLIG